MSSDWYGIVKRDNTRLNDCIASFNKELEDSKKELSLSGMSLEKHSSMLPGIVENRYAQLQEIEAILELLNIQYKKVKTQAFKKYSGNFDKLLSTREADKYVEGDDDVINKALEVNEFALLRNRYLALHKGLEIKQWQLSNIVKLRCAGLEDSTI